MGKERVTSSYIHINLGASKIHVLDVGASKTCTFGADCTVPKGFQRDYVSGMSGEFEWMIDKIPADSDANAVGVLLLWEMVNHNASICYCAVCGDAPNLFVREEEDSVGSLGDTFFALGKMMDFFAHCQ
jgi:hypothetical protein